MTGREWIEEFARRLDARAPTEDEWQEVLKLAAEAAHQSERLAAPMACWIAAQAGRTPREAILVAGEIAPAGRGG